MLKIIAKFLPWALVGDHIIKGFWEKKINYEI
jgi:hypothetical protein